MVEISRFDEHVQNYNFERDKSDLKVDKITYELQSGNFLLQIQRKSDEVTTAVCYILSIVAGSLFRSSIIHK